jgi:hypothetical protein
MLAPPPPFEVSVVSEKARYAEGEPVEVRLSLTNVSSEPIKLDMYPPEIQIKPQHRDEVVFSVAGGTMPLEIESDDTVTSEFSWDQKDTGGRQVSPGWYEVMFKDIDAVDKTGSRYGLSPSTRLLIEYPQGAMEKSLYLNRSETANDIRVTLESVELTDTGMTVFAFSIPPDYASPQSNLPMSRFMVASAEYIVDGGVVKQAGFADFSFLDAGIRYAWRDLDPVPRDAKELIIRIEMRYDDGPEESLGKWEFKISLE